MLELFFREHNKEATLLPGCQTVEQLLAGAELLHQHQAAAGEVGSVQLHQVGVMKLLQELIFPQHQLPLLGLVRGDLGSKHLTGLNVPAHGDDAETAPEGREEGTEEGKCWPSGTRRDRKEKKLPPNPPVNL